MKKNQFFIIFLLNIAVVFWLIPISECRSDSLWVGSALKEIQLGAQCEAAANDGAIVKSGNTFEEETLKDFSPFIVESFYCFSHLRKIFSIPREFEVQLQAVYTENPPRSPPLVLSPPTLTNNI